MNKMPEDLTCQDVREFLLAKKDEGLKATTLNLYNSAIRFFYRNVLHILWDDNNINQIMDTIDVSQKEMDEAVQSVNGNLQLTVEQFNL